MAKKTITPPFASLKDAVKDYQLYLLDVLLLELHICKRALDPMFGFNNDEIAEIFLSGGHQRRIPKKDLITELAKHPSLWTYNYPNFDALYEAVKSTMGPVLHFGDLTIYDVAKRIGYARGLHPEYVYLCSNTVRKSARTLLGLRRTKEKLPPADFAKLSGLEPLNAMEVENFLCVFSDYIVLGGIDPSCTAGFSDVRYRNHYSPAILAKLGL